MGVTVRFMVIEYYVPYSTVSDLSSNAILTKKPRDGKEIMFVDKENGYKCVATCMNLIIRTKTKSHTIKLKSEER